MAPQPRVLWLLGASALLLCPLVQCDCRVFPHIKHGSSEDVSSFFSFSTVVHYSCEDGYTLVGEAEISCRNAQWSAEAPQCRALCPKPDVANGELSWDKEQYLELETVIVQCGCGYGLLGPQSITCSENGTWSPEVPKCEWKVPTGCEQVLAGQKLLQCLGDPEAARLALEVYKLALEIRRLEEA
ncbi:apolipoprotein R-like isoform X2 [Erinaceus europaeus]|uniref:Apolipoprotein R-like isoform X2 n=1 Tax=Erinaceus europaeus TaxID=9365 RepID=A0ABM3WCQ1_ERIEU|nr:apolipoprotein R-like isoform X2 [Erinaceus europaeus]